MRFAIVIPAHNEESYLPKTLESLARQSLRPHRLVIVDDNSTDNTHRIAAEFAKQYEYIQVVSRKSEARSLPGAKVVQAFYSGLEKLDEDYDVVCKFDADLSFPADYLEIVSKAFKSDPNLGMAGGFCQIEKDGQWIQEGLTEKEHIRGALKAYRKACFKEIGGLKKAMGWDTIDEQLARYFGWKVVTLDQLNVKHWKPTGTTYRSENGRMQGIAFKRMRYGSVLSFLGLAKLALKKKSPAYWFQGIQGYLSCREEPLVSKDQGKFIRKWRWNKIRKKIF